MKLKLTEQQIKYLIEYRISEIKNNKSIYRELSKEEEDNAYASFVVVKLPDGKIACTTRPYEKNKKNKIGLPGGKVEKNETPLEAAYRESEEEGWKINKIHNIIASKNIKGKSIVWFDGDNAKKMDIYKEKNRGIKPIECSIDEISSSGRGNDFIKNMYGNKEKEMKEQESTTATSTSTSSSGGSSSYPQVNKWESGVTRGPANQIGVTKWSEVVGSTLKRGKANQLK